MRGSSRPRAPPEPGSLSGKAQPLLRLRRFEEFPDRELRRFGNRLVSVLEYRDVMLAGRPPVHFPRERLMPLPPAAPPGAGSECY